MLVKNVLGQNTNKKMFRFFKQFRDAHVKTPLGGAPEGFLRTNIPFFLRHMILKRDLPFDNLGTCFQTIIFLDPQKFQRG